MIKSELLKDQGVLIVIPESPLYASDFKSLARDIDPFIELQGGLHGLLIYTHSFPGWHDFSALLSHLEFVRDHQKKVRRVAAATDSGILSILPNIVDHFVDAEVRHFDYDKKDEAIAWLAGEDEEQGDAAPGQ